MSFDAIAPHYRWMERILAGERLQRCRVAYLDRLKGPIGKILIVGEGAGRFLCACRTRFPEAHITVIDSSSCMLDEARTTLQKEGLSMGGINFIHQDILSWDGPSDAFDLVVTHFFLDCFPPLELKQVIHQLSRVAKAQSQWLMADFQMPSSGLKRWRAKILHMLMYAFFRIATSLPARHLTPPDALLQETGFRLRSRELYEWDLLRSDLWVRLG